jgi:diguanylate cyclase (GGDEF)-like protein
MEQHRDESASGCHWKSLDLTTALRLLKHAGWPSPLHTEGDETRQLQHLIDALCDLSLHDGLTGLVNARFFPSVLGRELDRSVRTMRSCAVLLIDLDHFKAVNDTHGHPVGDQVLRAVAQRLRSEIRSMDTAARVGGEEFAVILPECAPLEAIRAATRLHACFNPLAVPLDDVSLNITVSAGLVWTDPQTVQDQGTVLALADRELYRAKSLGRRRLCHPPVAAAAVLPAEREALLRGLPEEESRGS